MRSFFLQLVALFVLVAGPAHARGDKGGWEHVKTKVGIKVDRKTMSGSSLFAFRGEGVLDVPIGNLVTVLLDDTIAVEWVDLMLEHSIIREETPEKQLIYEWYGLPWPISDRDYVMWEVANYDAEKKEFTLDFESVDDASKPKQDCCVRAMAYRTFWRLVKVSDTQTNVEVEVFTDPKGSLPAWLINMIQEDWPWKTIAGLRSRAGKSESQAFRTNGLSMFSLAIIGRLSR